MLANDPKDQFAELSSKLLAEIAQTFPVEDKTGKYEVRVSDLKVHDALGVDDIKGQFDTRMAGRSWAVPVHGTLEVVDKATGKTLVRRPDATIASIPKLTRHYSYIVGGQEKFIANQWRLKPGAYVRPTGKAGEVKAQFQLAKGKSFDIKIDPGTENIHLDIGRKVPLYSVLHALGASDADIEKSWGKDKLDKNRRTGVKLEKDLQSFYRAVKDKDPPEGSDIKTEVRDYLGATLMSPDVTKITLGHPIDKVTDQALLLASKKLLDVSANRSEPDPIDALHFKELWTAGDQFVERIRQSKRDIHTRIQQALARPKTQAAIDAKKTSILRDVLPPDAFLKPIYHVFTTSLSGNGSQINPVAMLADRSATTIMGPGGIQNHNQITPSNTAIDPSQLGYLDPVFTPEGDAGVTTHLAAGILVKDRVPYVNLYNTRTGKVERVPPSTASHSVVAMPDQVIWKGGKPVPIQSQIRVSDARGHIRDVGFHEVDYVLPAPQQVFSVETNLVPFMQNDAAGRTTMSARHMAQAISIDGREAPLVQVASSPNMTFEKAIGSGFLAHRSPVDGKVVDVKKDGIVLRDAQGKSHTVPLYDHYPLNNDKAMLHSIPTVRVGDTVKTNQVLADNNYTRNGTLALGTNLRVAYLANGANHEDGIVISESAARKLGSTHLHKPQLYLTDNHVVDKARFEAFKGAVFKKEQFDKIGDDGVIRVGQTVKPGDPLVLAMTRQLTTDSVDAKALKRLSRGFKPKFGNAAMTWDHDYEGEVVRVGKQGRNIVVHVKTKEPAVVGSKLSTRHSAKGIVADIMPDHEMPHDASGRPVEMLINPTCYDENTEFLTRRGWIYGRDLNEDDVFATMNPKTFHIEWQRAVSVIKQHWRGKMYRVKNQQIDLLVTPNHRMFTAPRVKGASGTLGHLDFDSVDPKHFTDATAEQIFGQPRRYLKAGRWRGEDPGSFLIPQGSHTGSRGPAPKEGWSVPSLLWAEFMGWFLSEGYTYEAENSKYIVGISQIHANEEKREQIRELLESMGFEPTETENGFVIYHKGLYDLLSPLGCASTKRVPESILGLPETHLRVFLDAYIAGDGNTRWEPDRGRYGTRRLSTNSKAMIDGLQEICIKLGYSANIKEDPRHDKYRTGHHYTMSIGERCKAPWVNWSETTKSNQVETWVDYAGMVYCCEVPNSFVVVRRNGVPVVSGNSVPGRMNPGQVLETVAGKIAEKKGTPYVVQNFQAGTDYLKKLNDEMRSHNVKESETLFDPKTGRRLGEVTVGPHYVFQLVHQIDKKSHVRSGGGYLKETGMPQPKYDADTGLPRGGGEAGAQGLGGLGAYGALAAGLRSNLREMHTLKSDMTQAEEVWGALNNGMPLPTPKVPFVFNKFQALMEGLGVKVQKDGSTFTLIPRTDKDILARSRGEITKPMRTIASKNEVEEKGGLFDPIITGGSAGGNWAHIRLSEPMPNPVYADTIRNLLDLKRGEIEDVIAGRKKLGDYGSGGAAFRKALAAINVDAELAAAKARLDDPKLKADELSKVHQRYKALSVLKTNGLRADEAYTLQNVPVLPPIYRPHGVLPDGTLKIDPLNKLYRRLGMVNERLLKSDELKVPYNTSLGVREGLYEEMKHLFGTSPKDKKALDLDVRGKSERDKQLPGIIHLIAGEKPKDGFFQDKMVGKKQDYTARATIVADPSLHVDNVGVPKKIAFELFRPMVAERIQRMSPYNAVEAHTLITKRDPLALRALEQVIKERPVILKRDPVLHQYGLIGQNVVLTESPAIKVNPLILPPINGDIDGDAVALYVPLSKESVQEVKKILPSQRTISASSGEVLFTPTNESALALYRMSLGRNVTPHRFAGLAEAEKAFVENKVNLDDVIHINGARTTLGRARMAEIVPEAFKARVLTDLSKPIDRKTTEEILKHTAIKEPGQFAHVANGLANLGFRMAYESGHTVRLSDIQPLREVRREIIKDTERQIAKLPAAERTDAKITSMWVDATKRLHDEYGKHYAKAPTNVSDMRASGIKAKKEQFQGLVMAPMLVEDHLGNPSRIPVTKSFAEGVDLAGYWLQSAGARRGVIQKTKAVSEPGYATKLLINANIDQPITEQDCGTHQGVMLSTKDRDLVDRYLASPVTVGTHTYAAGTTVTPELQRQLYSANISQVAVRSPLKCRMPHGICAKCMGLHPSGKNYNIGDNVGIVAAQALGERASQIMLKQTHGQGIVPIGGKETDSFKVVNSMFNASKPSLENAILAPNNGTVTRISPRTEGGYEIHTSIAKKPLYSRNKPLDHVVPGYDFKKGESLTHGEANMHDILRTRGIESVQDHMTKRIGDIYAAEGVLRRHVELAVRNATGVVQVEDPGDHPSILRGDTMMRPVVEEINRTALKGKRPIRVSAMLNPISRHPDLVTQDWIARLQSDHLAQHITTAVQQGQRSNIHGLHPIPGLAYAAEFGDPMKTTPPRY